jgi:hypothetical protein
VSLLPPIFVVYENPLDYPGMFVVRRWMGEVPDPFPVIVAETLTEARKVIPNGSVKLMPYAGDDPVILETWI